MCDNAHMIHTWYTLRCRCVCTSRPRQVCSHQCLDVMQVPGSLLRDTFRVVGITEHTTGRYGLDKLLGDAGPRRLRQGFLQDLVPRHHGGQYQRSQA